MECWTITEPSAGRFRPHLDHGGKPYWCMFDFTVRSAPERSGVEIGLADDADSVSAEWFPHLQQGILRGLEAARRLGREWVGVGVEVSKVHTHSTDTTIHGCERYGSTSRSTSCRITGCSYPIRGTPNPTVHLNRGGH